MIKADMMEAIITASIPMGSVCILFIIIGTVLARQGTAKPFDPDRMGRGRKVLLSLGLSGQRP